MIGNVVELEYKEACGFLMPRHYSGRKPNISVSFGWIIDNKLEAVCSFGKPASPQLCLGVCGKEYSKNVYELNRLCRNDTLGVQLSQFVSYCLRVLRCRDWIVISYADTAMNHNGYIYQACNFIYTGCTKERTDKYTEGNRRSRHYNNATQSNLRKVRSSKHRYLFFCTADKKLKKQWSRSLNYEIKKYPKGENKTYELGSYLKPKIITK